MKICFSIYLIIIGIFLSACTVNPYLPKAQKTIEQFGNENPQLITTYNYYFRYDKRFQAVCFLLANMPGKYSLIDDDRINIHFKVIDSLNSISASNLKSQGAKVLKTALRQSTHMPKTRLDINVISCDSVIWAIERSFNIWNKSPWSRAYSFSQFMEYVVPYRVANEPVEFSWKEDALNRFPLHYDGSTNIIDAAKHINNTISFVVTPAMFGTITLV